MAGRFGICFLILGVDLTSVIIFPYLVEEVSGYGGLISVHVVGHLHGPYTGFTYPSRCAEPTLYAELTKHADLTIAVTNLSKCVELTLYAELTKHSEPSIVKSPDTLMTCNNKNNSMY